MKTLQSEACINCCNPEDVSENFQDQLRAWKIILHRKRRLFDEDKISSKLEKYVNHLSMKYSHLSVQDFLQARPVQPCFSEASHKDQYSCRKCFDRSAQPRTQSLPCPMSNEILLAIQMSHFEKKSRKCACPKCPVLKSSYCGIEYMADGNAKPVDAICPCCRNAYNHGQSIDDDDTEDEREQEECPTAQPYLQMLHNEDQCIDALGSKAKDDVLMLPIRRLPCAGKNCPARFNLLCSVKMTRLTLGEVEFECPCDTVCFMLNCVHCNPALGLQQGKGKSSSSSEKYCKLSVSANLEGSSKEIHSPYEVRQQDSGSVSDDSSCNSPVLVRQKTRKISAPQ